MNFDCFLKKNGFCVTVPALVIVMINRKNHLFTGFAQTGIQPWKKKKTNELHNGKTDNTNRARRFIVRSNYSSIFPNVSDGGIDSREKIKKKIYT